MTWLDSETIRKLLLILSLRTGNQQLGFPTHIHKKEEERFGISRLKSACRSPRLRT